MERVNADKTQTVFTQAVTSKNSTGKSMPAVPAPVQKKQNKTGLPDDLKTGIENLSGFSMDDTKVHYNSQQPAQLNALAYAQGSDIHVGPGQEKHLAHEAWHVVQQKQGRVQATVQMKLGVGVNDDPGLENEADVMGAKALSAGTAQAKSTLKTTSPTAAGNIQMVVEEIHNATAFNNPLASLRGIASEHKVVEDGGSNGVLGEPYRRVMGILGTKLTRDAVLLKIETELNRLTALATNQTRKAKIASLSDIYTKINAITDNRSAAEYLRQNSLALSKIGINLEMVHNAGTPTAPGHQTHTFHRDEGFIRIAASALTGDTDTKAAKATALNGPFGTGWVKGHQAIDNMEHRFMEHVHVNKGEADREKIIYKGTEDNGTTAKAWASKGDLLKPKGKDIEAVENAMTARNTADLDAVAPAPAD